MTDVPALRHRVVGVLRRFDEPDVCEHWLALQAVVWNCGPGSVLSLLVGGQALPREPFAMVPAARSEQRPHYYWDVLDDTLLTARPVRLVDSHTDPRRRRDGVDAVEALCGLLDELGRPLPQWYADGDLDEWVLQAQSVLVLEAAAAQTGDPVAAQLAWAITWKALGYRIPLGELPAPAGAGDRVDGWHRVLDTLVSAQSAAATVLTVLAVEGGGRDVRLPSLMREKG